VLVLSNSPFMPFGAAFRGSGKDGRLRPWVPAWNPGNLGFQLHAPRRRKNSPLVVILHGCGQEALSYARDTGWLALAERACFALLLPEQRSVNNPDRCFNWFSPLHNQRHMGEAASIAAAVQELTSAGIADGQQIFITGLSAGGAMASVMLATYPELFAAGAIIAGIPYGCANWVTDARECMSGAARVPATDLAGFVLKASPHAGPWPRISVWHGSKDERVVPTNGTDIVRQWLTVHGLRARPHMVEAINGHPHRVWLDRSGRPTVEQYEMIGLGHGTPVEAGQSGVGSGARNVLDASISSTERIADFFGLDRAGAERAPRPRAA